MSYAFISAKADFLFRRDLFLSLLLLAVFWSNLPFFMNQKEN